ncbi:MAG: hypothetical protein V1649_01275 [Patescibacteria group bacterium]
MKKLLLLSILFVAVFSLSACFKKEIGLQQTPEGQNNTNNECVAICETALPKCTSLTENDCLYKCQNDTNIEKACLKNFQTCQELAVNCHQPSSIPEPTSSDNKCVMSCNNYVLQCISQVPGAGQPLRDDAYNSCMSECKKWDTAKINCMSIAPNCQSFTDKCGL